MIGTVLDSYCVLAVIMILGVINLTLRGKLRYGEVKSFAQDHIIRKQQNQFQTQVCLTSKHVKFLIINPLKQH